MSRAMIVVDVQNDFCPGGSLPVPGGDRVAERISEFLASNASDYEVIVATADWHPRPGTLPGFTHFSDDPDYVETWPPHCVAGTSGAEFHPALGLPDGAIVVRKGQASDGYSGFEGRDDRGRSLAELLDDAGVDAVDVTGLATDHCVKATALDAHAHGLSVRVIEPLVAGVATETTEQAIAALRAAGVAVDGEQRPPA